MKKQIFTILLLFSLLLTACGTTNQTYAPTEDESTTTFTDDMGREVIIGTVERAATLLGSFAQIWQLAGGHVCAAPDDAWDDLALDMPEDAVNLGSTEQQSLELLLSSEPDLIIASTNRRQNVEWLDTLVATGIPVAYFDVDDFDDYLRLLKFCTDLTGRGDLYEQHGLRVQSQIDAVVDQSRQRLSGKEPPTVLCMTASASTVRAQNSTGTVLGAMLKTLGCINIADSDTVLLENLSIEHILMSDPDYIFIVQRGNDEAGMQAYIQQFLMEHPAWSSLTAVKNGRVFFMEKALFNLKPNHRWGEAYEILEEKLQNG